MQLQILKDKVLKRMEEKIIVSGEDFGVDSISLVNKECQKQWSAIMYSNGIARDADRKRRGMF